MRKFLSRAAPAGRLLPGDKLLARLLEERLRERTCVDRLPPVLILHLKRFEFDFEAMKKVKLDDE